MKQWLPRDLTRGPVESVVQSDICVIGAGPVGLTVARALADKHRSVVLLERGPERATVGQTSCQNIEFDRDYYRGAISGRAFGAGGTSALWGGQLLPVRDTDMDKRPHLGAPAWPVSGAELAPYFVAMERWLDVMPGSFSLSYAVEHRHPLALLRWADWTPRFSKWIPFRRRNIFSAFRAALARSKSIEGYLNATSQDWQVQPLDGLQRVVGLTGKSGNGNTVTVRASAYVICAGALESARCVLELQEAAGGLGRGVRDMTGRYLHDHLSVRLARVRITDHSGFQRLFAPVFVGKTLRSLRMELSGEFLAREALPGLYAHFLAETAADSGFAVLREMLRGVQHGDLNAAMAAAWRIPPSLPDVAEILFERFVRRRLPFPRSAEVFLHCDFEQAPRHDNRVYLGRAGVDGGRSLHIDWSTGPDAARIASAVQSVFARFWSANNLDRFAQLEFLEFPAGAKIAPTNLYDIYHPAGTARMSADCMTGVVDSNLLVYGTRNVYVAGSAVFPSMGAANPTFTAMALGLRLADFIDRALP